MTHSFWKSRRVLILGNTGFKGSWLSLLIQKLGGEVLGYARLPATSPSLFEAAGISGLYETVVGDIKDLKRLTGVMESFKPQVVFNLAAQAVVKTAIEEPVENYDTNVMGTVMVLEAVRQAGIRTSVLNITSDKCYESKEWQWGYRENDHLGGLDPYSASKACAELITQSYRSTYFPLQGLSSHGVTIATARAGNVIGGGDWTPYRLIPDIVRAFSTQSKLLLRKPKACRPWQHVLDALNGYLKLAEGLEKEPEACSTPWNFGPTTMETVSVEQAVLKASSHWPEMTDWEFVDDPASAKETNFLRLDSSRAVNMLGWSPLLPVSESFQWTYEWYKRFYGGSTAKDLVNEQIENYLSRAYSRKESAQ